MALDYSKVKPFVYIMVCKDLEPRQIIVQACHAALESGIHQEHCEDFPSGLVMLQVSSEKSLLRAKRKIENKGIKCQLFWERPMERYTALATEAIPQDKRHLMKKFQLLSMSKPSLWQRIKGFFKK
jgi:hypothetical protein